MGIFCVLVGVSFCFVGVFFLDSVCRVLFFWRCVMGSSSVFRCNCVDRFMCIVLCEREDVRVLRHACHHVLMSPLFCLGQKLVALRVLDVSLGLVGCVGDSDADEGGVLEYQENCAGRYFVDEGGSSSSEVCDG